MDEDNIQTAEQDGFLEGWDDDVSVEPDPDVEADTSPEDAQEPAADEQEPASDEAEDVPGEEPAAEDAPQEPSPPRTWTLNRQGQPVIVGEQDLAALAQRGLDYDRLQAELNESKPFLELFRGFAADANMTPQEYLSELRARALQARGMTPEEARRAVELEDREAVVKQREAAEQSRQAQIRQAQEQQRQLEARRNAEVREFIAVFPDAAREEIPPEVWQGVQQGLSLTASYARYANAKAAEQAQADEEARQQAEAARKQNAANAARSTGSLRSAGNNHGLKDPFLEGWDED